MKTNKCLAMLLTCLSFVGACNINVAQAQTVDFNQYGFNMWVPNRFQNWNSNSSSKSLRYSNYNEGSSSIDINIISGYNSVEQLVNQEVSRNTHSYGTQILRDDTFRGVHNHDKGYVMLRTQQMGKYKVGGTIFISLENNKKIQVKVTMPDTDNNRKDFYGILNGFYCYNHNVSYGGNNNGGYSTQSEPVMDTQKQAAVLMNKGVDYAQAGRLNEAIDCYNQALALNPSSAKTYYNRGNAYRKSKNYEQAINDFTSALNLKSDYTEAYGNRGTCYHEIDENERALEDFTNAIRYAKNKNMYYVNRGIIYRSLKRYAEAEQDLKTVLANDPNYSSAYYHLAATYYYTEDYDAALQNINNYLSRKVTASGGYTLRAKIYDKMDRTDLAAADRAKAKQLSGK